MVTIVEFLRARLDEDATLARRAEGLRRWEALTKDDSGPQVRVGDGDIDDPDPEWRRHVNYQMWHCDDEEDGCPDVARGWIAEAKHIARHDPARVLDDLDSKRRLAHHMEEINMRDDWPVPARNLAQYALRLLALPYADHPDYDESWKP